MNYILKPSLEYIALVRVVGMLWNEKDIRDLIKKICTPFNSTELKNEWPKIEEKVKEKIPQLLLTELLKEKILAVIKPIGSQILRWIKYHGDSFLNVHLPNEFYWTPQGIIDEKKIAEILIKDESIDIFSRYKISCIYCLEDDVPKLWNKIPDDRKKNFYNEEDPACVKQPELVVFWTYDLKREVNKMEPVIERKFTHKCSPYQYAFEIAANDGNILAIEYFIKKLTFTEKEESLIRTAGSVAYMRLDPCNKYTGFLYEYYSDILCILLTHMNEEQQTEIFKNFPCQVLDCLLDWPWQIFFVETYNHMWHFLPERLYDCLLSTMVAKVKKGYKDFSYQKLFTKNWQEIPDSYKRSVLTAYGFVPFVLSNLIKIRDENNIKLVFQHATVTEKKRYIYSHCGKDFCKDLFDEEDYGFLMFFIQECLPSKDEMIKFRNVFKRYMNKPSSRDKYKKINNSKWKKFLSLLNANVSGIGKRKCMKNKNGKRKCMKNKNGKKVCVQNSKK